MSKRIYQQINLYQPIFRKQRQVFSAVTMLYSIGVVAIALLAIYAYGLWQVRALEVEAVQLEGREKAYAAQLAAFDSTAGEQRRRDVERELERLNAELVAQQRLIDVLEDDPVRTADGFSPYLTAFARRHRDGVWLTELAIEGKSGAMALVGRAVSPQRVADYLQDLSREPALNGQRFELMRIERSESAPGVEFRISSPSAMAVARMESSDRAAR